MYHFCSLLRGIQSKVGSVSIERLEECFRAIHEEQFTGCLLARSGMSQKWKLYFFMGRLIWGTGGGHRLRRWFRLLKKYLPQLDSSQLTDPHSTATYWWEYVILSKLISQNKIDNNTVNNLINEALSEVIFEIMQEAATVTRLAISSSKIEELGGLITMVNPLQALHVVKSEWEQWIRNGLVAYSPNFSPIVKDPKRLKQKVPEASYDRLSTLLTGRRSLREIATHLKTNPLTVSQPLLPFVHQGIISLQPIPDLIFSRCPKDLRLQDSEKKQTLQEDLNQPLIFCLDDSLAICHALEKVITFGGYQFIGVQDALQALPVLIEKKPSLIFLDLIMPIASGYEICAQIRRVEALKMTPVIILTGKDGMVDRVRAKLVGASDFLTKPIKPDKVLDVIKRYLSVESGYGNTSFAAGVSSENNDCGKSIPQEYLPS